KSSATGLSLLSRGGVYYAFLMKSQRFFRFLFLTPRCVAAVAVSVDAHYREFFWPDKRNFQKRARQLIF
ncbi:hypothetical protein, partial [Dickeya sp. ws52]|uniref:hypothetical protein n=1 Tax=Dickeya sp. ws52 TaxID=2576377 RepID=UPI001F3C9430